MPKTLLLADDSITIQKVIGITFANEDFVLTTVDNGVDAIATARRLKPDLILADVVMPGKNGYEVCEHVKHDPELGDTPVLLLAGTFESFDEAEMARVGADGYVTKPFESQTLIDKVHELIARAEESREPAGGPVDAEAPAGEEFNLDDFSPFEEITPARRPSPEAASPEPVGAERWTAEREAADEDAWDLSDFEPAGQPDAPAEAADGGDTAFGGEPAAEEVDPLSFADGPGEAEPAGGLDAGAGIDDPSGEALFDFGEPDPTGLDAEEAAFAGDEPFTDGPAGEAGPVWDAPLDETEDDVMELHDIEEVVEEGAPPHAGLPEPDDETDLPLVPDGAADGWELAAVSEVRPADQGSAGAGRQARAADVVAGQLTARLEAAAEDLAAGIGGAGVPLPPERLETIVSRVTREVIEEVAWEVVPDLCEALIREEIRRITGR